MRCREDKVVGGVCGALSRHLSLPLTAVRVGLALSVMLGGFGLVVYAWLWALVPAGAAPLAAPAGSAPAGSAPGDVAAPPCPPGAGVPRGAGGSPAPTARVPSTLPVTIPKDLVIGGALLLLGLYLLALRAGWPVRPTLVVPVVVVVTGVVIAFSQFDEVERDRWARRAGVGGRGAVLRVVGGLGLVVVGVLLLVVGATGDVAQMGRTLVAALSVLGGVGLVLAPWGMRLWRDLDSERAARAREAERADIAAHLHDSVLQTLALIQRRSHNAEEVARLARAQERDLRSWLYGGPTPQAETVASAVAAVAADVEDLHAAVVEVVTVGDRTIDERIAALLAALREALTNAARHGGGAVQVYVECGPEGVEAFVRDRGPGFDPEDVSPDRLGVRESIVARMERHGGSARVVSAPGEGTEIRLCVPERTGRS